MSTRSKDLDSVVRHATFDVANYILAALASAGADTSLILRAGKVNSLAEFRRYGPEFEESRIQNIVSHALHELSLFARMRDGRPPARPDDWQLLIYCLVSCKSLREAITRMIDFFKAIDGRCGNVSLQLNLYDEVELQFDCPHPNLDALALAFDLTGMASIYGLLNWLVEEPIPVHRVLLPYPEALRRHCHFGILPFPTKMGADVLALRFPAQLLDHPVIRSGEDCEKHSLDFLPESRGERLPINVADQARRILFKSLRDDRSLISLDTLSERLGRNRETVRRQLRGSGSSYKQLKDSCRREMALNLLRRTNIPIEDVAARLDFCDSDAFRRTFNTWLGVSPSEYRRSAVHN